MIVKGGTLIVEQVLGFNSLKHMVSCSDFGAVLRIAGTKYLFAGPLKLTDLCRN